MPFTATITTTKPSNTIFFGQVSDANKTKQDIITAWTATQPGFISQTSQEYIDENTRVQILVWETQEDFNNYRTNRAQLPEQIERKAYNTQNGITASIITK